MFEVLDEGHMNSNILHIFFVGMRNLEHLLNDITVLAQFVKHCVTAWQDVIDEQFNLTVVNEFNL